MQRSGRGRAARSTRPANDEKRQLTLDSLTSGAADGEVSSLETDTTVHIWSRLAPAEPTIVYTTYWHFAAERQRIFFRRFEGASPPWTEDPILREYKFTNAYRASDRVSQFLLRDVIYTGGQSPKEVFFRILLFKLFNRIETWTRLQESLGGIRFSTYRFSDYDRVLTAAIDKGERIYSGAYIMPSGARLGGESRKHRMHLRLLETMMREGLPERLVQARSMSAAFELLRSYPSIGDFLAYQYVIDLNYSTLTSFSEQEFVVPGPGARNGIRKCFRSLGDLNESDVIHFMADRQEEEFARLGLTFRPLWSRRLQLVDCQNLFCEVDKYARIRHPEIAGRTSRTRIKQRFRPSREKLQYWYPPKWGINDGMSVAQETFSNPSHRPEEEQCTS